MQNVTPRVLGRFSPAIKDVRRTPERVRACRVGEFESSIYMDESGVHLGDEGGEALVALGEGGDLGWRN